MNLLDKLIAKTILIPMVAINKEDAIQEMLNHLQSLNILSSTIKLFTNIKKQENNFTSSAGRGIAYPHSTSMEVDELTCVLGISKDGIDFNSPDGHACHIILLTLSPANEPTEHRKFITRFRSMVDNPIVRSSLHDAEHYSNILDIILGWEDSMNRKDDVV